MSEPQIVNVLGHDLVTVPTIDTIFGCKYCPFSQGHAGERCANAREARSCDGVVYIPVDTYALLRLKGEL